MTLYSFLCSNFPMEDSWRPYWWAYPLRCREGHPWGPGRVVVGWTPCPCAGNSGRGHLTVACAAPGCDERWYEPPHAPRADLRGPVGEAAARDGYRYDWHP